MREVVEAALASQTQLDEGRMERAAGKGPPCLLVLRTKVLGAVETEPGAWVVGMVREVEATYMPKEQMEFVTWLCNLACPPG